jgi:hypothetical protein
VLDLPLELARFAARSECGKCELLRGLAPPPTLNKVQGADDFARGHRPDLARRIVGGNESVDGFG